MSEFDDFKNNFIVGSEIEFYYKNELYFVTNYFGKSVLLKVSTENEPEEVLCMAKNRTDLFQIARIKGNLLKDIYSDIEVDTIY